MLGLWGVASAQAQDAPQTVDQPVVWADGPPAPPTPGGCGEYTVFFLSDQYLLTPEAEARVSEAAQCAVARGAKRITIVGYNDTLASEAYSLQLSRRRAMAVGDSLVAHDVSPSTLSIQWRGETRPALPTGDGVSEPLNRRVTIDMMF